MKESARTATRKNQGKKAASGSVPPAKTNPKKSAAPRKKSAATVKKSAAPRKKAAAAPAGSSPRRGHSAATENSSPKRPRQAAETNVQPIRAAAAKKRAPRRKADGLENWVPQGPVHVGGVMNRGPQPGVHFAGVENRSHAAHLNDVHAELHPNSAVKPLHGPFPARLKQP